MTRLYAKYELPYAYQGNNRFYDKAKEQYTYARENMESLRRASGQGAAGEEGEQVRSAIVKHVIKFIKQLLYLACGFFIFTLVFKNVRRIFLISFLTV